MSKRYIKLPNIASTSKRAKLEITRGSVQHATTERQTNNEASVFNDLWGEDFEEDVIEEIDFIASQYLESDQKSSNETLKHIDPAPGPSNPIPSTSSYKGPDPVTNFQPMRQLDSNSYDRPFQNNVKHMFSENQRKQNVQQCIPVQHSQKLASSEMTKTFQADSLGVFDDFKSNLLDKVDRNSTFCPRDDVIVITNDVPSQSLKKLDQQYKKLLEDFITKQGETDFLRKQLQQLKIRLDTANMENVRLIEEQTARHKAELNAVHKEQEKLKTQLDFQTLQLSGLMEKCKLLESGSVKLTEPHAINKESVLTSTLNTSISRSTNKEKSIKVCEISVQTDRDKKTKIARPTQYPIKRMPRSIFKPSLPEKFLIDLEINAKHGKKYLPILQDEDEFRIFENPQLVSPKTTLVDSKILNVEFVVPEIAGMIDKSLEECNAVDVSPAINKLLLTAKELLLNTTEVLQRISHAMQDDDIKDMDDVYFSDFYETQFDYTQTVCDPEAWYEEERGVEARRIVGVLSYIATASSDLNKYIAGKATLLTDSDPKYNHYAEQMTSYKAWHKRGCQFEMLELFLEFMTAVGFVRRSHQFSGLICAILNVLRNVQKRLGFCSNGLKYVSDIFKEAVFSRPLSLCQVNLVKTMATFSRCNEFAQKLCNNAKSSAVRIRQDVPHFTNNSCPLEIFIAHVQHFELDPITLVKFGRVILRFAHRALSTDTVPQNMDTSHSCNCFKKLLKLAVTTLCKCSNVDFNILDKCHIEKFTTDEDVKTVFGNHRLSAQNRSNDVWIHNKVVACKNWAKLDDSFRQRVKRKRLEVVREGIMFLCYLSTRDPDFLSRVPDIEDSYNLFMQNIDEMSDLNLPEREREALNLVKSTFVFERAVSSENRSVKRPRRCKMEKIQSPVAPKAKTYNVNSVSKLSRRTFITFKLAFGE
ncbi:uncharacterized protein LOC105694610 [Orussus abietinus]|uniref:uncharacterized protein LOC105694610 n=1 Tax=Orussus abietinus TaxID=222816 RepID=UPI0006252D78|nr:uncharacterized protein LOC105694610 [Orussus abietinus]